MNSGELNVVGNGLIRQIENLGLFHKMLASIVHLCYTTTVSCRGMGNPLSINPKETVFKEKDVERHVHTRYYVTRRAVCASVLSWALAFDAIICFTFCRYD